jgi:hypothetical protein
MRLTSLITLAILAVATATPTLEAEAGANQLINKRGDQTTPSQWYDRDDYRKRANRRRRQENPESWPEDDPATHTNARRDASQYGDPKGWVRRQEKGDVAAQLDAL